MSAFLAAQTNSGTDTGSAPRIIERESRQYVVWPDGRIELILDEETARRLGVILERFDSVSQELEIERTMAQDQLKVFQDTRQHLDALIASQGQAEAVWQARLDECAALISQEQEHIDNLEAEKRPSHVKAYVFGGIIGAGLAAVLVTIGDK